MKMDNWQPIETAPKDGTRLLVWNREHNEATVARWGQPEPFVLWGDMHCWTTDQEYDYSSVVEATHWMLLPGSPDSDAAWTSWDRPDLPLKITDYDERTKPEQPAPKPLPRPHPVFGFDEWG